MSLAFLGKRELPDGSVEVYDVSWGSGYPRYLFRSAIKDPQGNALTFTYDSQLRIVAVTDAIGQVDVSPENDGNRN
jgi:YD repeat-containing protein